MHEHDRPIWTASQMVAELETAHSKETVRKKLNALDEVDVCESMQANNGRVYWWKDERSDWPIPPDIIVDGQEELTVAEMLAPWYAKLGLLGLVGPAIAGFPLVLAVFEIAGAISLPISGTTLLAVGLSAIIVSYMLLVYAGFLGFTQLMTGDRIDVDLFR